MPREGRAPGAIRTRGDDACSLFRAVRSVASRDKDLAPLEWAISDKLEQAGYTRSFGGLLVPLGGDALWRTEGHERDIDRLAVEVKDAWSWARGVDPEEYREKSAVVSPRVRDFLPFLMRMPPPPEGWRIKIGGVPDMPRSLAEHGKYCLPKSGAP